MTNENRCGSKGGRRAKKKLSHPGDEISKCQGVEGEGGRGYALYRNKRNPMGGSAKYISHRSCSRQSLSYRDRSIFDGANTGRPPLYLQYKATGAEFDEAAPWIIVHVS